jgi:hypothetical protein
MRNPNEKKYLTSVISSLILSQIKYYFAAIMKNGKECFLILTEQKCFFLYGTELSIRYDDVLLT